MYARGNINNQITTVLVISYHFTCLKYRPPNVKYQLHVWIVYPIPGDTRNPRIWHISSI